MLLWWGRDALSEVLRAVKLDSAFFYNGGVFRPVQFSFAQFVQVGALHHSILRTHDCLPLADRRQCLWPAILMAVSRTSSVEHEWHTLLIVLHCGEFSLILGGRACCGLISLGCEIGPAEDQTHV